MHSETVLFEAFAANKFLSSSPRGEARRERQGSHARRSAGPRGTVDPKKEGNTRQ